MQAAEVPLAVLAAEVVYHVRAHALFGGDVLDQALGDRSRAGDAPHVRRHQWEWTMTAAVAAIPLTIWYDPGTIEASSFRHILDWGVTPVMLAYATGLVALVRGLSLWFNGYKLPWSAFGRIVGAAVTGLLWLQMGVSLYELHLQTGRPPSIGVLIWGVVFAGSEVWSCYRAASDAFDRTYRS